MEPKFYSSMTNAGYTSLWNKYRPAILQMMVSAEEGPTEYKFFKHEFETLNPREKGGYTFKLHAFQGKAQNNIRSSEVAKDLLNMLESSRKASALMEDAQYEFTMDRQFVLHVTRLVVNDEVTAPSEEGDEAASN